MAADQDPPPEDTASIVPAPKVEEPKPKSYPMVLFKGEIKIFPDRPLPKYNQGAVKAYEALTASGNAAFALVCEKNIVPQSEIVHKYAGIITPHLPKLVACGVLNGVLILKSGWSSYMKTKWGHLLLRVKTLPRSG